MRISDWSSDVCSSDLSEAMTERSNLLRRHFVGTAAGLVDVVATGVVGNFGGLAGRVFERGRLHRPLGRRLRFDRVGLRSEEHTSELQSLMRISYAVFCLKKKKTTRE